MSIVNFPPVIRKPRAVTDTQATVIAYPKTTGEFAAEAIEKLEQDKCADIAMSEAQRELDIAVAKLAAIAIMHQRQAQARTMIAMATERMKIAFA